MAKKRRAGAKRLSIRKNKKRLFLPWPAEVFLLLCIGVLLAGWTLKTSADTVKVTARVPAAPLTEPAIITNPDDGQHFTTTPVNVSGTCPDDSYVSIFRNGLFAGSALCNNQAFSLLVDLLPGANELKAQDYNITDDPGPVSASITVYYDVPVVTTPGSKTPSPAKNIQYPPFVLQTDFTMMAYEVGDTAVWKLQVSGGKAPYLVSVDWGDGTVDKLNQQSSGEFEISHIYKSVPTGGIYTVKVNGSDALGQSAYLQFFLTVKAQSQPTTRYNGAATKPPSQPPSNKWLLIAWPIYGVVLLMYISFWLGEKEAFILSHKKHRLRHS